jgi:hypothetical protein
MNYRATDLAYAAGIIDGEGCISGVLSRGGNPAVQVVVQMDGPIPFWLATTFGGTVYPGKGYANLPRWQMHRRELLLDFLPQVLPYLKQKGRQVELLLMFLETCPGRGRGHVLTDENHLVQAKLVLLIQDENQRLRKERQA